VRVIVDTNILVSGLISAHGNPGKIVDAILDGQLIPIMSSATFEELEEVLSRSRLQKYFGHARVSIQDFLTQLKQIADFVPPKHSNLNIRDEKDLPFIDLAATIPPPEYIITGDKDFEQDRYHGVSVISASLFVKNILRTV
jgi:putative PIN family toxin of toxin-antitoxin system